MDVNQQSIFSKYINNISVERDLRLLSLKRFDSNASFLWTEAIKNLNKNDKNRLIETYNFAKKIKYKHVGLSSNLYFAHPLRVSSYSILLSQRDNIEAGVIGLLHNILEVSKLKKNDLKKNFGDKIANAVEILTVDRKRQWEDEYKKNYYSSINNFSVSVRVVKVLDKFDNLFNLNLNPDKGIVSKYLDEIKRYIIPLVKRDLSFMSKYFNRLIIDHEK